MLPRVENSRVSRYPRDYTSDAVENSRASRYPHDELLVENSQVSRYHRNEPRRTSGLRTRSRRELTGLSLPSQRRLRRWYPSRTYGRLAALPKNEASRTHGCLATLATLRSLATAPVENSLASRYHRNEQLAGRVPPRGIVENSRASRYHRGPHQARLVPSRTHGRLATIATLTMILGPARDLRSRTHGRLTTLATTCSHPKWKSRTHGCLATLATLVLAMDGRLATIATMYTGTDRSLGHRSRTHGRLATIATGLTTHPIIPPRWSMPRERSPFPSVSWLLSLFVLPMRSPFSP
jgi:hypothetical protein